MDVCSIGCIVSFPGADSVNSWGGVGRAGVLEDSLIKVVY